MVYAKDHHHNFLPSRGRDDIMKSDYLTLVLQTCPFLSYSDQIYHTFLDRYFEAGNIPLTDSNCPNCSTIAG